MKKTPRRLLLGLLTGMMVTPAVALAATKITYKSRVETIALIGRKTQAPLNLSYKVELSVPSNASIADDAVTLSHNPNEYLGLGIQMYSSARAYLYATAKPSKYAPTDIKDLGHGVWRSIVGFKGHEYYFYAKELAANRALVASLTTDGATAAEQKVMFTAAARLVGSAVKA